MKFLKYKKGSQRSQEPFMGKKGEMTTEQIVIMIVAIASFAVILYFLASLSLGENTEDELCRNSVVQRGNLDKLPGVSADTVPLKCEKSYVCLTKDGSCENMYKPEERNVKNKVEVYEVLAEELANCWWMFGEGKINYGGEDLTKNLYCSFCSQIAFDDSVKDIFPSGEINENELYLELTKLNKSEGMSYFKYLFGTSNSKEFLEQDFGKINLDNQYYSLTAITGKLSTASYILGGAAATAFVVGTGGFGSIVIAGVAGGVAGGTVAATVDGLSGNSFIPPTLIKVNSEELKDINCDYVTTSS